MVLRILIWLALLFAAWTFLRPRGRATPPRSAAAPAPRIAPPEAMVGCARCGVHLPASEASRDAAGRAYCGAAHRAQGPRGAR